MDGIAVRSAATVGASETSPILLRIGTQARWVDTGDPLPEDADAVIMLEQLQEVGDGEVEIMQSVAPWQHVRPLGEDIVATELVLPEGRRLSPAISAPSLPAAVSRCWCGANRGSRSFRRARSWSVLEWS